MRNGSAFQQSKHNVEDGIIYPVYIYYKGTHTHKQVQKTIIYPNEIAFYTLAYIISARHDINHKYTHALYKMSWTYHNFPIAIHVIVI